LVRTLVQLADPRVTEIEAVALALAQALGWDEGAKAMQAVLGAEPQ
jgi:hypothetical protein